MTTRSSKNLPHCSSKKLQEDYDTIAAYNFIQEEIASPKIDPKTIDYDKIILTTAEQSSRGNKKSRTSIPLSYEITLELKSRHPNMNFADTQEA